MKLFINYRDELGNVLEQIDDEETEAVISFCDGKVFFNNSVIDVANVNSIGLLEV